MPEGVAVTSEEDAFRSSQKLGLSARGKTVICYRRTCYAGRIQRCRAQRYLKEAVSLSTEHPVLIDQYIQGKEIEVDAIADGEDILIPGIMEHVERAGVHSGDSISVYPDYSLSEEVEADSRRLYEAYLQRLLT